MTRLHNEQNSHSMFFLTRMIYCVCSGVALYKMLELGAAFLLRGTKELPWGVNRFDLWFHARSFVFVLAMLVVTLPYRPKAKLFRWPSSRPIVGVFGSVGLGLAAGIAAFALASPVFWLVGDTQLESVRLLIAHALSPLGVLDLVLIVIALAVGGEVVYQGIVFRTLSEYGNAPAAVLGSSFLFAYICPVLDFPAAIILGIASAVLYYRTRNLLAPITANAVFTVAGGALTLYHALMRR
jgi:membrane protease YdiL (CAAX protease family)